MGILRENIINFKLCNGIILLSGELEGNRGFFAFDTGATKTVLNVKYCNKNSLGEKMDVVSFNGALENSKVIEGKDTIISLGELSLNLKSPKLMNMDYVETPLRNVEEKLCFLGALGLDSFQMRHFIIDYKNCNLVLNGKCPTENMSYTDIDIEVLPVVNLEIENKNYRFVLDTGANHFVIDKGLYDNIKFTEVEDSLKSIDLIKFANNEYKNIQGLFSDLSKLREVVNVSGIIGYQLLKDSICYFDFEHSRLYIS